MNDFQKYLVDEFLEDYSDGRLPRREALKMIAGVIGSLTVANALLAGCAPAPRPGTTAQPANANTAELPANTVAPKPTPATTAAATAVAATATTATSTGAADKYTINIPEDDPTIEAGLTEFASGDARIKGYLARPVGDGQRPAVLVCHENRGLTEHIKDVTRRLAKSGYVALAVDLLSRQGGTSAIADQTQVPGMLGQTPTEQLVQDFEAGWAYLQGLPFVRPDGVGMVGFCFGGGVTWQVATQLADLKAAVPYYGPHPSVEDVPGIQAAVLGIYAGRDQRINQGIDTIEAAMKQNGKVYEKAIYPDTDHAFHNDTGTRYNADAARDAWSRTMAWFAQYLGTP